MELRFKKWNDISIDIFNKLKAIDYKRGDDFEELNANISLLSILCGVEEDEIAKLTTGEFNKLLIQTEFLKEMPKVKIQDKYIINGNKYEVFLSLKKMSVAQYIDFQTYYKDVKKYFKELLSVFLIPQGKKYGEGYDIDITIKEIGEHLSIVDANSILFFFAILFQSLTKTMLTYSIKDMKKMKKKMKSQEEIEKMEMAIQQMEKAKDLVINGAGFIW